MNIPPSLPISVRVSEEELRFPSVFFPNWMTAAGVGAGALASVALALSGVDDAAVVGIMSTLLTLPLGGIVGWMMAMGPRDLVVSPGELSLSGWFAPELEKPARLALVGDVGRPLELVAYPETRGAPSGYVLADFTIGQGYSRFTYDGVTWIAETTAELLGGLPVDDRRDADAWQRWADDPEFRMQVAFDIGIADNRDEFPEHHATQAVEPESHRVDLDGMSAILYNGFFSDTVLEADSQSIQVEGTTVPLEDLSRAAVFYTKVRTKNSTTYYAELRVLWGTRTIPLSKLVVTSTGGETAEALTWAAEEIMRLASSYRGAADRGDQADIPVELRNIASRTAETQ